MFEFLIEYSSMLIEGFITTIEVTFFGSLVGLLLGALLAIGDLYGGGIVSTIIGFYVEFFRGSPIVVQLFIFYFSIPKMLNVYIDPFTVGLIVFALNSAAYQKGYIKGAMESIYRDQILAALSLGLTKMQIILYIILPQALRIVLPAWSNEFCSLGKSSAALLTIGVMDLTNVGKTIAAHTWRVVETYAIIALIYFIWISIVVKIVDIIYDKIKIPGISI
jgi:polar amino acid transport system permease protein